MNFKGYNLAIPAMSAWGKALLVFCCVPLAVLLLALLTFLVLLSWPFAPVVVYLVNRVEHNPNHPPL